MDNFDDTVKAFFEEYKALCNKYKLHVTSCGCFLDRIEECDAPLDLKIIKSVYVDAWDRESDIWEIQ